MSKIKMVFVGDGGVGKDCLLKTYLTNKYPIEFEPNIYETYTKTTKLGDRTYDLELVYAPGQDDYDRLRVYIYPQTDVFLVCFSVVFHESFESVIGKWIPEISSNCPKTPFLLVGTKTDLRNDAKTLEEMKRHGKEPISFEDGRKLAKKVKATKYVECSARTQEGLNNVINEATLAACQVGECTIF